MEVVCRLEDLPDPGSLGVDLADGREIFVVRREGSVFAYENHCPHTGGPLDWLPHQFLSADRGLIQCATHDALFRIDDGRCLAGPCASERLTPVAVAVRDGRVIVEG